MELKALVDLRQEFKLNKQSFSRTQNSNETGMENTVLLIQAVKAKDVEEVMRLNNIDWAGYGTFNSTNGVLTALINTGQLNLIQNDSLKYALSNWMERLEDYLEDEIQHVNFYLDGIMAHEMKLFPFGRLRATHCPKIFGHFMKSPWQ